jgi:hypothetical protein
MAAELPSSDTTLLRQTVKRRVALKWTVVVVLVLVLIADALWLLVPWWQKRGLSVIPTYHFGKVENGSVFDKSTIDLGEAYRVILPDNTKVYRMTEHGKIYVFMEKQQGYAGHPTHQMTLLGLRKNMGCVARIEDGALVVATFGEWDSHIEGGAMMKIVVIVPEGLEIEKREGLSGERSAGHQHLSLAGLKEEDLDEDDKAWRIPADGWTAIPDVPDPNRIAE